MNDLNGGLRVPVRRSGRNAVRAVLAFRTMFERDTGIHHPFRELQEEFGHRWKQVTTEQVLPIDAQGKGGRVGGLLKGDHACPQRVKLRVLLELGPGVEQELQRVGLAHHACGVQGPQGQRILLHASRLQVHDVYDAITAVHTVQAPNELGLLREARDLLVQVRRYLGFHGDQLQVARVGGCCLRIQVGLQGTCRHFQLKQGHSLVKGVDREFLFKLGKEPFPFDLLYWNSDSTRMPYRMHSFYLRNMYMKNLLKEPGGIELNGVPIDISKVKIPAYFISTIEDHIAPWKSTYLGATRLGGPVRFVLGGSGHIAGIVNPPSANKYHFWTNEAKALPATPEDWFEGATQHPGSWWTDWQQWIGNLNGDGGGNVWVPARDPAKGKLKALEDAPGSFVKFRLDQQKKS